MTIRGKCCIFSRYSDRPSSVDKTVPAWQDLHGSQKGAAVLGAIGKDDLFLRDYVWYAADRHGRIARFTTGGSDMLPAEPAASRELLEELCSLMEALGPRADSRAVFDENPRSVTWTKRYIQELEGCARRGLYCFDIQGEPCQAGGYRRLCSPTGPITLGDMTGKAARILPGLRIDADFSADRTLAWPLRRYGGEG